ncbi:acetyl-CoA synthetase-like protein [Fistulina hepatica ATCC 64428]|nr:acetyl-CoA synthetase-like protein [Fistulina hepatica ATCC 64428]
MAIADYLVTDDLTILLGLIAATLFLLHHIYKPQPLVHPIILGRQSDVSRVRNPGESAVYRNYSTGHLGRFPLRPNNDVHVLSDLIRSDLEAPRMLWNTRITNAQLQDRIAAFGTGLLHFVGLDRNDSNVLLLLNDGIEFIISDMALAAHSIPSFTLESPTSLAFVLEGHPPSIIVTNAEFLPHILELIYDSAEREHHTIVVVGQPSAAVMATVASQVKILLFADVEREGLKVEKTLSPIPQPGNVFSVSFYSNGQEDKYQGVQLMHQNITAGVAAVRGLLPPSIAFSPLDTIVSSHSLGTPFGRAIAYTAIYDGASFATLDSSKSVISEDSLPMDVADVTSAKKYRIPSPTVMFIRPTHLEAMTKAIMSEAERRFLAGSIAWRHKISGLAEGYISKDSLWDRLVYDAARAKVLGEGAGALRAVVVSGGAVDAASLASARVALSVPIVLAHTLPFVAGPVFASHAHDLQDFALEGVPAHVGPPSVNIEVKLTGIDESSVQSGADPIGALLVRGPAVGKHLSVEDYVEVPPDNEEEGWYATECRARAQTNGSFQIVDV